MWKWNVNNTKHNVVFPPLFKKATELAALTELKTLFGNYVTQDGAKYQFCDILVHFGLMHHAIENREKLFGLLHTRTTSSVWYTDKFSNSLATQYRSKFVQVFEFSIPSLRTYTKPKSRSSKPSALWLVNIKIQPIKNNLLCFGFLSLAGALILTNHKALLGFKITWWALCTRGVLHHVW